MLDFVIGSIIGPMDDEEIARGFIGYDCKFVIELHRKKNDQYTYVPSNNGNKWQSGTVILVRLQWYKNVLFNNVHKLVSRVF